MDQITFHYDTVLSDIHMLLPNTRHLMTRLNRVGQPVFVSSFRILSDSERVGSSESCQTSALQKCDDVREAVVQERGDAGEPDGDPDGREVPEGDKEPGLDEDGDFDVSHRPRKAAAELRGRDLVRPMVLHGSSPELDQEEEISDDEEEEEVEEEEEEDKCLKDVIRIEHTMATPLDDVGKQVWRGAFLLADFILSQPDLFRGATVLELGAGTGFTSIVMATVAKTVFCTDVGDDLLSMCRRNISSNQHLTEAAGGEVKVRQLDWLRSSLCTEAEEEFSWTEEEEAQLYDNTGFIIAADVIYDDDLTDGLFQTLYRLCSSFRRSCSIYLSLEKRMNFTLREMDVCCEAYRYFRRCLSQLQELEDGRCRFHAEQLPVDFAQHFQYERIQQLELWKVTLTPLLPEPELKSSSTQL